MRVTAQSKLPLFNKQRFSIEKNPRTVRIFCLGGSTTYGRPYDETTSFCGWLRAFLPQADPSRQWEVINAGGISYASYRVALLMEELIGYDPDLFIIYSGHNEFLEKRTYSQTVEVPGFIRSLGALVSRTRIAAALKQAVEGTTRIADNTRTEGEHLPAEVETILEQDMVVGPEAYHRDELFQQNVLEHYRYNLRRMIDMARSMGSNVLLVNPASNLRHCSPFKSEHREGLPFSQRQRWQALFNRAKLAHETGSPQTALAAIREAAAIDDGYAHLDFLRGQVLWQLERYREAKAAFSRARDQDICPLRILSPMQQILRSVATEQQVTLLDFVKLAEQHSENHVPGENFFLDHVHPTIEGHRLLALALLEGMQREKIVNTAGSWNKAVIREITRKLKSRLDDQAHSMALHNLAAVLSWAGKFEEAHRLALRAIERFPDNAQAHYQAGINGATMGQNDRAIAHYQRALQLMPDHVEAHAQLGKELFGKGRLEEAIHHCRRSLELRPGYAEAHTYLGSALLAQGNSDEAIHHYQRSAQLKPADRAATSYNLGNAYQVQGKPDEAIRYYRLALRLQPGHAATHTNLGNVLLGQGHIQEAASHFRQALESEPNQAEAHIGLGNALASEGQLQQAIRHYRRALQTKPNDAMAHYNLGNVLYSQGQLQKAILHFRNAVQTKPGYGEAHNNLGLALAVSGQLDNALLHFERAFEIDPNWAAPLNGMASILAQHPNPRRRNPARAVQFAKTSLRADPTSECTHSQYLGLCTGCRRAIRSGGDNRSEGLDSGLCRPGRQTCRRNSPTLRILPASGSVALSRLLVQVNARDPYDDPLPIQGRRPRYARIPHRGPHL